MPEHQDVLAVVNAGAGSSDQSLIDGARAALRDAAGRDADVELVATTSLDHLAATLRARGGRRVVILGGDGSIQAAVQVQHQEGSLRAAGPMGIIPMGTANDLAHTLDLPADVQQAARVALRGEPREMSLLLADDGVVAVNAVHVGVGAAASANAARWESALHRLRLGAIAYPAGALLAGLTHRGWWLRVRVDGTDLHCEQRVLMAAIGFGGTVGGGAPLVPAADPHDSVAEVVVSGAVSPLARLGYANQLRTGAHVRRPDVRTARGRVVQIEATRGESFPAVLDGEVRGPFTAQRWELHSAAWQAMTPGPHVS